LLRAGRGRYWCTPGGRASSYDAAGAEPDIQTTLKEPIISSLSTLSARRKVIAVAIAILSLSAVTAAARPARVPIGGGPPCYGPTCVGRDPNITDPLGFSCVNGGSGATDLVTVTWGNTYTLRWSDFCHANWVRAVDNNTDYYVETYDGHKEWGRGYYTFMVNGNELARLCYTAIDGNPSHYYCTGWY